MAYYIVNFDAESGGSARDVATAGLRGSMCPVAKGGRHVDALVAGDLVLVYVGPPVREFIGRAVVAGPVCDLPAPEPHLADQAVAGLPLVGVEQWDPPVSMAAVLRCIDPARGARADIPPGVVRITEPEYEGALAAASHVGASEAPTGSG